MDNPFIFVGSKPRFTQIGVLNIQEMDLFVNKITLHKNFQGILF